MPARTVVFDSIQKHDGMELRTLNAAEYIQVRELECLVAKRGPNQSFRWLDEPVDVV